MMNIVDCTISMLPAWLRTRLPLLASVIGDAAILLFAYNLLFLKEFGRVPILSGSITILATSWVCLSYLFGRYSLWRQPRSKRVVSKSLVLTAGTAVVVGVALVLANWTVQADDPRTYRSFLVPFLSISTIASVVWQYSLHRKLKGRENWLIICSAAEASLIEEFRLSRDGSKKHLQIYMHDNEDAQALINPRLSGIAISECSSITDKDLEKLLVYRGSGGTVCSLAEWWQQKLYRLPPELVSSRRLATSNGFKLQPNATSWRIKRLGDVVASLLLLIATLPVIMLSAMAVFIEDRHNPFYSQIRTGIYGSEFLIWKIRTMSSAAEKDGVQWSSRNDPRVTRVGRLLRQIRIDELPQLINVLKGEMSLIGPRPERPEIEEELEKEISHYRVRHWIRPGLSGWAQVSFPYGASVSDSRIKTSYDLYYIKNYSLMLDLLILLKTILLVSTGSGSEPKVNG